MRAVIIGFGGQGQRHYKAYRQMGMDVAAISEWKPERVRQAVPEFPEAAVFTDVDALLARTEGLDVVSVTTNAPTHAATTVACAEAGVGHILCEKPMATNLADARRMIEVCRRRGVRLAVNHIRRFSPNHAKLRCLLSEGVIGRIRHFSLHHGSSGLGNNGVHFFDTMRMYAGNDARWVVGYLDPTGTPNPRGAQFKDPGAFGIMLFTDGTRAFIDMSEDTGVLPVFTIVGEHGRVEIDEFSDRWRIYARRAEDRAMPLTRYVLPMPEVPFVLEAPFDIVDLIRRALEELLAGGPLSCTGEDGMAAVEMAIAFHISDAQGHSPVALPLSGAAVDKDVPFA